jgi:translation initiation factor IF-3
LKLAEQAVLDLVEISPKANPPVCKIMDFGKFKYEISKRDKELKKKQHHVELKEIRMRPKTEENDLNTKVNNARKFLQDKNKVKFTVMFRGREMAYQEFGRNLLEKVVEMLSDISKLESEIKTEGRNMHMILTFK